MSLAKELENILEDGIAIFFTPDDEDGVSVWLINDDIHIAFWYWLDDEGVWARNSGGLEEIVIPLEEEKPYQMAIEEIFEVMPDFDLNEVEEVDPECLHSDLSEDCFYD